MQGQAEAEAKLDSCCGDVHVACYLLMVLF